MTHFYFSTHPRPSARTSRANEQHRRHPGRTRANSRTTSETISSDTSAESTTAETNPDATATGDLDAGDASADVDDPEPVADFTIGDGRTIPAMFGER
jgi:hypothetical protein